MPTDRAGPTIRRADARDAEPIRSIYNHYVERTLLVFDILPRTAHEQQRWLDEHAGAHPAIVATDPTGMVTGFGSLSPYRTRPAYATTVEDSVYVHPDHTGRGAGRALLAALVELAATHGFHSVIARIVGDNDSSVRLHERCGFTLVGVEREVGRKRGRWLDVVEMQLLL